MISGRGRRGNTPITRCEDLSESDREILRLLTAGYTAEGIAREVNLAVNTIKNKLRIDHASSIFDKIGVQNRSQAIAWYTNNCEQSQEESFFSLYRGILTTVYICVIIFLFLPLYLYADVKSLPYIYSDLNLVVPAFAGICGLYRVRHRSSNENLFRRVIRWLSMGLVAWAIGQVLWIIWIFEHNDLVPYPGPGDIGYFAGAVFLVWGIYLLQIGLVASSNQQRFLGVATSLILITANIAFTFWARNGRVDLKEDPLKLIIDITYPTLDAVAIGILVQIIWSGLFQDLGRPLQRMVYIITAGMAVLYIADVLFGATTSLPDSHPWAYYNGSWADRLFTTAFWILGIGISFIPLWYRRRTPER